MSRVFTQEDIDDYEEDMRILCPFCEKRGYHVLLGPKILMPGEQRKEDYESWLECPRCYEVIPIQEGIKKETIKNAIETIESPFEDKLHLESVPKRSSPAGKKASAKRRRNKIKLDHDPEIDTLLRVYGDRDNIIN